MTHDPVAVLTPILILAMTLLAFSRERQRMAQQTRAVQVGLMVLIGIGLVFGAASLVLALTP